MSNTFFKNLSTAADSNNNSRFKKHRRKEVKKQQGLPILQIPNLQDSVMWKTLWRGHTCQTEYL